MKKGCPLHKELHELGDIIKFMKNDSNYSNHEEIIKQGERAIELAKQIGDKGHIMSVNNKEFSSDALLYVVIFFMSVLCFGSFWGGIYTEKAAWMEWNEEQRQISNNAKIGK